MWLPLLITILKIIGLILLIILAAILFIVLIILFVPFRYKIIAEKREQTNGSFAVSWLFGIISVIYDIKPSGNGGTSVKLLGIRVWRKKDISQADEEEETEHPRDIRETKGYSEAAPPHEDAYASRAEQEPIQDNQEASTNKSEHTEQPKKDIKDRKNRKSKKSKPQKNGAFDTLKKLREYENKSDILQQVFLLLKRLFKLATSFKIWADFEIGTGQPHTTGYVLALCGLASSCSKFNINAEGNFEDAFLLGNICIKGRIFICSLVWAILMFALNKNIFPIIKKLIFTKG